MPAPAFTSESCGVPPVAANATSTVGLVIGTSSSIVSFRHHLKAVREWLPWFIPVGTAGAALGSWLLTQTSDDQFSKLVPFLVLFATVLFFLQGFLRKGGKASKSRTIWFSLALQLPVAIYGAFFGAGIGILMLAIALGGSIIAVISLIGMIGSKRRYAGRVVRAQEHAAMAAGLQPLGNHRIHAMGLQPEGLVHRGGRRQDLATPTAHPRQQLGRWQAEVKAHHRRLEGLQHIGRCCAEGQPPRPGRDGIGVEAQLGKVRRQGGAPTRLARRVADAHHRRLTLRVVEREADVAPRVILHGGFNHAQRAIEFVEIEAKIAGIAGDCPFIV